MTNKKLTDEEIIKGLTELSLYTGFQEKHIQVLNASLDLINRQKDEIERLKEFIVETRRCDKEIKFETIKEFADLSIKRICEQVSAPTPSESYIVERCNEEIDNLVKEMVGEEE